MQTKKGEQAKGLAGPEFCHLMKQMVSEARAAAAADPDAFPDGIAISLDNAKWHTAWQENPPADIAVRTVPPYSPDIHKVVEHPLHAFEVRWKREFTLNRRVTTCEGSMALASEVLRQTSPDSVRRDMETLRDTMLSIERNGGDWADRGLC